jgi:phospholipid/cholesterol/gamma-HCH transport system substrate-binding protein
VILNGGSPARAFTAGTQIPVLVADQAAGQTMSNAARQVLARIDKILEENSNSLHSMLSNLDTFSTALGRNSDRVDSIFSGLERMTGGPGKSGGVAYELSALRTISPPLKPLAKQLAISEAAALLAHDSDKLVTESEGGLVGSATTRWADTLPKLIQARVLQSFENNGSLGQVARFTEGAPADQLALDIRRFQIVTAPEMMAEVELGAKVVTIEGRIVAASIFKASAIAKKPDGPEAASALDTAFGNVLTALLPWAANAIAGELEMPSASAAPEHHSKRPEKLR